MKAIIVHLSNTKKSAILAIRRQVGPIVQNVSGFVQLPEGHNHQVGEELDIPAKDVKKEVRTLTDKDTGEVRSFDWLEFTFE